MILSLVSGGDGYIQGAIALGVSLNYHEPKRTKVMMVEDGNYTDAQIKQMEAVGWTIKIVEPIRSPPCEFKAERWPRTFTKLHMWDFEPQRAIYIDADCFVLKPFYKSLINRHITNLGGCWVSRNSPRFNAGMVIIRTDPELAAELRHTITHSPPEETDAAWSDQGFLNKRFKEWTQIPDKYNWRWWKLNPPQDLTIAHLRPHPWTGIKSFPHYMRVLKLWQRALASTKAKK